MELKLVFSKEDICDWKKFERVRLDGSWNMFDSRAIQASGLEKERYFFVLKNYSKLKEAVDGK